jgi:hypothetical protein
MSFKHVEEQIAWLRSHIWLAESKRLDAVADTMQALLDRNRLYVELEDACIDMTYADAVNGAESWDRMCSALAKLQEQNDEN